MAFNTKILRLAICFTLIPFTKLFSQNEPLSGGIGINIGSLLKLPGTSGAAPILGLRIDGRIPVLSPFISAQTHAGWEYTMTRVESNNAGKTLQTARAQYLRAGMSLNFRLFTSRKQTGIELGGGLVYRRKIYESSDWQLTGGQTVRYFPKSQILAPVQIIRFTENDKRRVSIFAEMVFNTGNRISAINGMSAGIQWNWFATQRKQYFKGTHRTLQWDDIWPAQLF